METPDVHTVSFLFLSLVSLSGSLFPRVPSPLVPHARYVLCFLQSKKRQYDQEVENLERQQKQTIERLEQEHTNRLRDEAKRIKAEQDKELSKYQNMLKNRKKEVRGIRTEGRTFLTSNLFDQD